MVPGRVDDGPGWGMQAGVWYAAGVAVPGGGGLPGWSLGRVISSGAPSGSSASTQASTAEAPKGGLEK